jgi:hypothetical protein
MARQGRYSRDNRRGEGGVEERRGATELAAIVADLQDRLTRLERTGQLAYSTIEGGAITATTIDGTPTMYVGQQYDGTTAAVPVVSPTPPTPTRPILTPVAGGLNVAWDGRYDMADDPDVVAPMDFARAEIHVGTFSGFTAATTLTLVGTFETPRGGSTFVQFGPESPLFVVLVVRSTAGKASPQSAESTATPLAIVTYDVIDEIAADIERAENAASTALSAAKNAPRVFWSATDPSATADPPLSADSSAVWFKGTDATGYQAHNWDGNRPEGERWQPRTFGREAIAEGAIGVNELADSVITARKMNVNRHFLY